MMHIPGKGINAELPDTMPGLNVKAGVDRIGGSVDAYVDLLRTFDANRKDAVQTLREYLQHNQLKEAGMLIHTLSGVTGNIGAEKLYAAFFDLGQAVKNNESGEWGRKTDIAQACLIEVRSSIAWIISRCNTANPEQAAVPCVAEDPRLVVKELADALEGCSADARRILDRLKNSAVDQNRMPEVDAIEKCLASYDFEAAARACGKLAERFGPPDA